MKILRLATNPSGGAGIAACSINDVLSESGIVSDCFYFKGEEKEGWNKLSKKKKSLWQIILRGLISHCKKKGVKSAEPLCHPEMGQADLSEIDFSRYDLVHLHTIGEAFINLKDLSKKIRCPVIWTMHDLHATTAVSHYLQNDGSEWKVEEEYKWYSGKIGKWLIDRALRIKRDFYLSHEIHLVAISNWVYQITQHSEIGKLAKSISIIHNAVPDLKRLDDLKLKPKDVARKELNLSHLQGMKVYGAGAVNILNARKGGKHLYKIIEESSDHWLLFGSGCEFFEELNNTTCLGEIKNRGILNTIYAACDAFLISSLEEALGKTGIEALSNGTPTICFDRTGSVDYTSPDSIIGRTCRKMPCSNPNINYEILSKYTLEELNLKYLERIKKLL